MSESNNKLHHHQQQLQQQQTTSNTTTTTSSGFSSIGNNNISNSSNNTSKQQQGNIHSNFNSTSVNYNNTTNNTSKPAPTIPFVSFNRRDPPNSSTNTMECTSLTHLYVKKGYVQRDYSRGTKIRFETTLPSELENFISQSEFAQFIEQLNDIYADAEKLKFCEGCMACLTAYLLYCCIETHKQKCMRRAAEYITDQNDTWKDRGITVFDPMTRGFRILEIQVHTNSRPQ